MTTLDPTTTRLSRRERWAPAFGFVGLYEVSTLGRVRRVQTKLYQKAGRLLKGTINGSGYRQHSLYDHAGVCRTVITSRLILASFTQDAGVGLQARHLNGFCQDNRLANLSWGTHAQNEEDKVRHGSHAKGSNHGMCKIDEHVVREIRKRGVRESAVRIGKDVGLSQSQVLDILNYKSWKHI